MFVCILYVLHFFIFFPFCFGRMGPFLKENPAVTVATGPYLILLY